MRIENCQGVGKIEKDGKVFARDMLVQMGGVKYMFTVYSTEYLQILGQGDLDLDINTTLDGERCYVLEDVSDAKDVCGWLAGKSFEELGPFLVPQTE